MPHCPNCGAHWRKGETKCWHCQWYLQLVEVPREVTLKRRAVDLINKNPEVAKKVVQFLGIDQKNV